MLEIVPNWHPVFVHFTVALLSVSAGLFVLAPLMKPALQEQWLIVARWTLWIGAGFTVITGLTGLYAYTTVVHDTPSHAAMTDHRNWAIATMALFLAITFWSIIRARRQLTLGTAFVVSMVVAGALLASTAWRGGEVVYRYGLGVMSLPKAEGDGHAHEHADGGGQSQPGDTTVISGVAATMEEHHDDNSSHHDDAHSKDGSVKAAEDTRINSTTSKQNDHHDDGHKHNH